MAVTAAAASGRGGVRRPAVAAWPAHVRAVARRSAGGHARHRAARARPARSEHRRPDRSGPAVHGLGALDRRRRVHPHRRRRRRAPRQPGGERRPRGRHRRDGANGVIAVDRGTLLARADGRGTAGAPRAGCARDRLPTDESGLRRPEWSIAALRRVRARRPDLAGDGELQHREGVLHQSRARRDRRQLRWLDRVRTRLPRAVARAVGRGRRRGLDRGRHRPRRGRAGRRGSPGDPRRQRRRLDRAGGTDRNSGVRGRRVLLRRGRTAAIRRGHPRLRIALPRRPDRPIARAARALHRTGAAQPWWTGCRARYCCCRGDEDKVVPPSQSELFRDAMVRKHIPHAYLLFAGEQHGFPARPKRSSRRCRPNCRSTARCSASIRPGSRSSN